jgi:hypothetical protein
MVGDTILAVREVIVVKFAVSNQTTPVRRMLMSDLQLVWGEVMFLRWVRRRKWWNQFNSCAWQYGSLCMYVGYTIFM